MSAMIIICTKKWLQEDHFVQHIVVEQQSVAFQNDKRLLQLTVDAQ